MKVVTGSAMAELDRKAIQDFALPGIQLMEKAGSGAVEVLQRRFCPSAESQIVIAAGGGNNGGDGFVMARLLLEQGYKPFVFLATLPDRLKGEALHNYQRYTEMGESVSILKGSEDLSRFAEACNTADVIVDALLGTGMRGEAQSPYKETIQVINQSGAGVLAVDVPSGLNSDDGTVAGECVRADVTVTMQLPKLGLLVPPGVDQAGAIEIVPLDFPKELLSNDGSCPELLTTEDVAPLLPLRSRSAHKGNAGHLLILAGSPGLTGAAALAAESAVRSGAGLVTLGIPKSLNPILESKITEPMTLPLPETPDHCLRLRALETLTPQLERFTAVAIGPGLGRNGETGMLIRELLRILDVPVVLDADGITPFHSGDPELRHSNDNRIITPHPGELSRFVGVPTDAIQRDRLGQASEAAKANGINVVLKGAMTVIAEPSGGVSINSTGNPAMASGGMGDVLTGVIGALLAQGLSVQASAKLGVFVHGLAADRLVARTGALALLASQVSEELTGAFAQLGRIKLGG